MANWNARVCALLWIIWFILLPSSWIAVAVTGNSDWHHPYEWTSSIALSLAAWIASIGIRTGPSARFMPLIATGMTLGMLADMYGSCLAQRFAFHSLNVIVPLFSLGHVAYIGGVVHVASRLGLTRKSSWWRVCWLIGFSYCFVAVALWINLVHRSDDLLPAHIPTLGYTILLALAAAVMTVVAWFDRRFPLMAIGGLFFLISDGLLAVRLFQDNWGQLGDYCWIVYGIGQMMIVYGALAAMRRFGPPSSAENWLPTALAICLVSSCGTASWGNGTQDDVSFDLHVRPILSNKCFRCHGPDATQRQAGLQLDTEAGATHLRDEGAAVIPYDAAASLLYQRITTDDANERMPPADAGEPLTADEIDLIRRWITQGASWARHWAFRNIVTEPIPAVADSAWLTNGIDAFVLARLEAIGMAPSVTANRRVLIRRLTFDLIGLPPTSSEVESFVADRSVDAYVRLVDRLLASPHYGERWGRAWMDLVRYSDTTASWLTSPTQPWRYRDWVIEALNRDLSYREFTRRQLAADQIPDLPLSDLPALGLLGLSPTYWKELRLAPELIRRVVADEWDERLDMVTRTFLGLTVSCARCHDHKFDPITMADYYGLAGVFANTQLDSRPLVGPSNVAPVRHAHMQVGKLEAMYDKLDDKGSPEAVRLAGQIAGLRRNTPGFDAGWAPLVTDARLLVLPDGADRTKLEERPGEADDLPIFERGNPEKRGPVVPRRFLSVFSHHGDVPLQTGSGRIDLADALFSEARDLTARVIVNRVWEHHFGQGLVQTPSNFGNQGEAPSHPQLLDWLAAEFVAHDWSLKWLHRQIVTSATYRQVSDARDDGIARDPANRYLWRMNRRRLDVEMWRDAMLATSGRLDRSFGGKAMPLASVENRRRTVYGKIERREISQMLRIHDFPEPTSHSPHREQTITPLQQLYCFNAPFVDQQAEHLSKKCVEMSEPMAIQSLYRRLFGREASGEEVAMGVEFVTVNRTTEGTARQDTIEQGWRDYVHALLGLNEFYFVD